MCKRAIGKLLFSSHIRVDNPVPLEMLKNLKPGQSPYGLCGGEWKPTIEHFKNNRDIIDKAMKKEGAVQTINGDYRCRYCITPSKIQRCLGRVTLKLPGADIKVKEW